MKKTFFYISLLIYFQVKCQKIELIESFIGYTNKSEIISFTPNSQLIMSGDYSGNINLWDLKKQKLIKTIQSHDNIITSITFHNKKNNFLTCSEDSTIKLWSLYSNRQLDSLKIEDIPTKALFNDKGNQYFV